MGRNFELQNELVKTEINHEEVAVKNYKDEKYE